MLKIRKSKLIALSILCLQILSFAIFELYKVQWNYKQMSIMVLSQILINVVVLKSCGFPIMSVPNLFGFFSLLFHCGQIIKKGFDIKGTVPLPFENYATQSTIQAAFSFYLISQVVYYTAVLINFHTDKIHTMQSEKMGKFDQLEPALCGKVLLFVGVLPRIYVDALSLIGAKTSGYEGVYSLYIPQVVQSMAFFFDAGLLFLLLSNQKRAKKIWLFIGILAYKCLMMATGSRQDKVAFLLIWIYLYFFVINKITFGKSFVLAAASIAGFIFISAIGAVRGGASVGIKQALDVVQGGRLNNIIGGALGEFGASLDTLEVAIQYTPSQIPYGFGRSYLAGILSIIPLVVNQIPFLAKTVIFLHQLPNDLTFAFGGSYLGELFYNFSWFGIIGNYVVGFVNTRIHNGLIKEGKKQSIQKCLDAVVATAMILFVRGYFTDMVQKLAWTYFAIYCVWLYQKRKSKDSV